MPPLRLFRMPAPPNPNIARTTGLDLGALLRGAWFVYRPGLGGGFVFDDFVNLDKLGAGGRVDDWAAFWRYLTSGTADPTRRP